MKMMITICAACKRELKTARGAAIDQIFTSLVLMDDVVYSHGICNECIVTFYGAKDMTNGFPNGTTLSPQAR